MSTESFPQIYVDVDSYDGKVATENTVRFIYILFIFI